MKNKKVFAASSYESKKYFFESEFNKIPEQVKNEIKEICILMSEKLFCTFIMGFYSDGEVYFEIVASEYKIDFDNIGAELEVKEIQKKYRELFKELKLWYTIFKCGEDN